MLTLTRPAATSFQSDERAPLRVVVADDHALYRRGIVRALERDPMLQVIGEASDGAAAAALILALEPDVAVLDVRMPELDGLEVCAQLNRVAAELPTRCLVLTAFDDGEMPLQAMAARSRPGRSARPTGGRSTPRSEEPSSAPTRSAVR